MMARACACVCPRNTSVEESLPLILLGPDNTLQLKTVQLLHAASLLWMCDCRVGMQRIKCPKRLLHAILLHIESKG